MILSFLVSEVVGIVLYYLTFFVTLHTEFDIL